MIRVISTGGTIAESPGHGDRFHLSGQQLIDSLRGEVGEVEAVDLMDIPSTFVTTAEMIRIRDAVAAARAVPSVSGVVVTHGTATLEETAFFVDLTSAPGKPIVFTGAMLTPDRPGYDGLMNFRDAIKTAAHPQAHDKGVLVVMGGQIHSARHVVKGHSTALNSFRSPEFGALGRADGELHFVQAPVLQQSVALSSPPAMAAVEMVTCYAGIQPDVFDAIVGLRPAGLIVQGMGSGTVSPWIADKLEALVKGGLCVVLTTRCAEGRVLTSIPPRRTVAGYPEDLYRRGVIPTTLPALKARLKLSLLLGLATPAEDLKQHMMA
jgi:L-asparaginase